MTVVKIKKEKSTTNVSHKEKLNLKIVKTI